MFGKYGPNQMKSMAPDDGGAGGAAGGDADEGAKPVTRAELAKLVSEQLNGAMKSWGARVTKGLPTADDLAGIKQALEGLKGGKGGGAGDDADADQGDQQADQGKARARGNQANDSEATKQLKKLQSELDQLRERDRQRDQREKAREDEIAHQQEELALATELRKHLRPELVDAALALQIRRGVVGRDKDGKVVIKAKRDWGEESISIADGVKEWIDTDEGKVYLPPKKVGGSGDKTGGGDGPQAGDKGVVMNLETAIKAAFASQD